MNWTAARCRRYWFGQLRKEGVPDEAAALRAVDRCFSEGFLSECQADRLEARVRQGDFSAFDENNEVLNDG